MSSLAERLAAARKQTEAGDAPAPPPPPRGPEDEKDQNAASQPRVSGGSGSDENGVRPRTAPVATSRVGSRRGTAEHERLEELKQDVHPELLKQLGPQLYDANLEQAELDQRVRAVLSQLMSWDEG